MQSLEYLYHNPPKNTKFIDRKCNFQNSKIILQGGINSGKTTLIIEYLETLKKEFLYINLNDIRIDNINNINEFIRKYEIKAVAFDNAQNGFLPNLECENIIISTNSKKFSIDGFSIAKLAGLDYEEFIAFYKKNYEAKTLFSHFLSRGNSAKSPFLQDFEINEFLQTKLLAAYGKQKCKILSHVSMQIHQHLNTYQIYKDIKHKQKISKDSLYNILHEFEDENIIYLLKKTGAKSSFRRVYFGDFGLKNALSLEKDPRKTLANMVFCELLKLDLELMFDEKIDFFIPQKNLAILVVPFLPPELIFLKLKKSIDHYKNLNINKINIISNANSANTAFSNIKCDVLPFWQWAAML